MNIINEQISNAMTAEYLLSIERKIVAEEDEQFAKEKKERKLAEKNLKKQNKNIK